ncbi:hypothetical protein FH972_012787 [Carpinus fangiana]|uniref:Uncharacterized protein n=1 Tax=Carpinus fangiana TaxID=176857 RepID=A0A5N6R802_9ROSI|nr:hypothetical protein FH972_012787 [Carpinus fangiana]
MKCCASVSLSNPTLKSTRTGIRRSGKIKTTTLMAKTTRARVDAASAKTTKATIVAWSEIHGRMPTEVNPKKPTEFGKSQPTANN